MGSASFVLDLTRFKQKTEAQLGQVIRKICLDMLTLIIMRSPVDTGRFKANNQVDLGALGSASIFEFDKDGRVTISKGNAKLAEYRLGDTIFFYNNVEYALALEYGHSKQAPAGVYRMSVQDIVTSLGQGRI